MGFADKIISSIKTIVDNENLQFDKTIQAIVLDNSDLNKKGELKVQYQDAVLKVYCPIEDVKKYPKKSNIYVTIPNNNMSEIKTVKGLVEKIGPIGVGGIEETFNTDYGIYSLSYEILDKPELNNIENNSFLTSYETNIFDDLTSIKKVFKQSEYIKISMRINCFLSNDVYVMGDYGLKLIFSNDDNEEKTIVFNTDYFSGNPYSLSNEMQTAIFKIPEGYELKEIKYFRNGFYTEKENYTSYIKITNFSFESVYQTKEIESDSATMYISTPQGACFANNNDTNTLTLTAVIKKNKVQVDNSELKCRWYKKGIETDEEEKNSPNAIDGWILLNKKEMSNTITLDIESLDGLSEREFLAVGYYEGVELNATTTIKIINDIQQYYLEQDGNTYTLKKKEESPLDTTIDKIVWYYSTDFGVSYRFGTYSKQNDTWIDSNYAHLLDEESERGLSITINANKIINAGKIVCEIFRTTSDNSNVNTDIPTRTLYANYNGQTNDSNYYLLNSEQVFLFSVNGKRYNIEESTTENQENEELYTSKYTMNAKPIKIMNLNPGDEVQWSYVDSNMEENPMYTVTSDLNDSVFSFQVTENYPSDSNNIYNYNLCATIKPYSSNEEIKLYTDLVFVKEGDNGTNGSGLYCRIIPNVSEKDKQKFLFPFATIYTNGNKTKLDFNFVPETAPANYDGTNTTPFKTQVWRKNSKVFDGWMVDNAVHESVRSLKWKCENTNSVLNINSETGTININNSYDKFVSNNIKVVINNDLQYVLPLICIYSQEENNKFDFSWNHAYCPQVQLYYYDENGEYIPYVLQGERDKPKVFDLRNIKLAVNDTPNILSEVNLQTKYPEYCRSFTIENNQYVYPSSRYYPIKNNNVLLLVKTDIRKNKENEDEEYDKYIVQIPLMCFVKSISENLPIDWSGEQAYLDIDNNYLIAEKVIAGIKNNDNTFSGTIIGKKDNDEIGINVYNGGRKTFSVDKSGKTIIGKNFQTTLAIDADNGLIEPTNGQGIKIDYINSKIDVKGIQFQQEQGVSPMLFNIPDNDKKSKTIFELTEDGILKLTELQFLQEDDKRKQWWLYKPTRDEQDNTYHLDNIFNDREEKTSIYADSNGRLATDFLYIGKGDNPGQSDIISNGWFGDKNSLGNGLKTFTIFGNGVFVSPDYGFIVSDGSSDTTYSFSAVKKSGEIVAKRGFYIADNLNLSSPHWKIDNDGIASSDSVYINNDKFYLKAGGGNTNYLAGRPDGSIIMNKLLVNNTISAGSYMSGNALGESEEEWCRMKNGDVRILKFVNGLYVGGTSGSESDLPVTTIQLKGVDNGQDVTISLEIQGGIIKNISFN